MASAEASSMRRESSVDTLCRAKRRRSTMLKMKTSRERRILWDVAGCGGGLPVPLCARAEDVASLGFCTEVLCGDMS